MLAPFVRRCRAFARNTAGNVALMTAFFMPIGLGVAAFAVDQATLFYDQRELQAATDVAAIVAAANLGNPETAARRALQDNGILAVAGTGGTGGIEDGDPGSRIKVTVTPGVYTANRAEARATRFKSANGSSTNAVKVSVERRAQLYFAATFMRPPKMRATATARSSAQAAFSVGSRLASLNGGIINAVLGGLTGTTLSLDVMDYRALVDAQVNVLGVLDALATELNLTAGTYQQVLDSSVTVGQLADALVEVTDQNLAVRALTTLARDTRSSTVQIPLRKVFSIASIAGAQVGHGAAALDAEVGVFDILSAALAVADGTHQVVLNLGATIPGLSSSTATLSIGEPPAQSAWFAVGDKGHVVKTAQTRLKVVVQVGGKGLLAGLSVRLPLYVEVASASAKLTSVSCPSGAPSSGRVELAVTPAALEAWIGEVVSADVANFSRTPEVTTGTMLNATLVRATVTSHVAMNNLSPSTLTFTGNDIGSKTPKNVSVSDFTGSLTSTLLREADIKVKILGLGLGSPQAVQDALAATLSPVTPAVDSLIGNVLNVLGVKVGEADVWVSGVRCQRAVLVQ